MARRGRVAAVVMILFALAPVAVALLWAARSAHREWQGPLILLCAGALLPACLGWVIWALLDRRGRGLVLRAVRGGAAPAIEIGAREGFGRPLVLPLRDLSSRPHLYRFGYSRNIVVTEAVTATSAGDVLFARGSSSRLDRELARWLGSVLSGEGTADPSPGAVDVEATADAALQAPLDAPPGIEAVPGTFPTWRYRGIEPRGRSLGLPLIAVLALWTFAAPRLEVGSYGGWALWTVPVALAVAYRTLLLTGPITVDWQVRGTMLLYRARRFGLTLWMRASDARRTGLYVVELPFAALTCGGKVRGFTSPGAGGPDAAAMAWLSAAIRACAADRMETRG
jgi:hypothetical protein